MFTRLLASAAPRQRSGWSLAASVTAHVALGSGAILLTAARPALSRDVAAETPIYVTRARPAAEPVRRSSEAPRASPSATVPSVAPVVVASISAVVPTTLPDVGVPLAAIPAAWSGAAPGVGDSDRGGAGRVPLGASGAGAYDELVVDAPVVLLPGGPTPRYPELLRGMGVEGRVSLRFVVDTMGRVEAGSITVVEASHALFAAAARETVLRQRFMPALLRQQRVRQLVLEPFTFAIRR